MALLRILVFLGFIIFGFIAWHNRGAGKTVEAVLIANGALCVALLWSLEGRSYRRVLVANHFYAVEGDSLSLIRVPHASSYLLFVYQKLTETPEQESSGDVRVQFPSSHAAGLSVQRTVWAALSCIGHEGRWSAPRELINLIGSPSGASLSRKISLPGRAVAGTRVHTQQLKAMLPRFFYLDEAHLMYEPDIELPPRSKVTVEPIERDQRALGYSISMGRSLFYNLRIQIEYENPIRSPREYLSASGVEVDAGATIKGHHILIEISYETSRWSAGHPQMAAIQSWLEQITTSLISNLEDKPTSR